MNATTAPRRYCARSFLNSSRTDSVLPHICTTSARPGADLADCHLAGDLSLVEQLQRRVHGRHRRGVAEAVRDDHAPVPVVAGVWLRVAGDEQDRGVDVAAFVEDPQVELEVGPVVWKRVDDLGEGLGEGHMG